MYIPDPVPLFGLAVQNHYAFSKNALYFYNSILGEDVVTMANILLKEFMRMCKQKLSGIKYKNSRNSRAILV